VRALTLLYHDVVGGRDWDASGFPGRAAAGYKLDLDDFERHLAAVSAVAARRGTVRDVLQHTVGPPPVLLTFDDGGASAYAYVADLLERAGWRGHFFITTDYLDAPKFVTRAQVRELAARGHVIGTHSCSHPLRMSACSWDRLVAEWGRSAAILSDVLGEPVRIASVPGGAFSRRVAAAAAAAGIAVLFTSEPMVRCRIVDDCVVIGRYALRRGTRAAAAAALASGSLGARLAQFWSWNLKKVAKAVGGEGYSVLWRMAYGRQYAGSHGGPRVPMGEERGRQSG